MRKRPKAHRVLVILLGFLIAACGGGEENAESENVEAAPTTPTTHAVTISSDGAFSPNTIAPDPGDVVSFRADGADVVLCVDPSTVFGGERYPIADGSTADLTVQDDAIHVDFAYVALVGDLEAACGSFRGGEGGGKTGP